MNAPTKLEAMTYATMNALIPDMRKGQSMVYHIGSLMFDRLRGAAFQTVHGVALAAWQAYERGDVTLVQRKLETNVYEYIAIKR